MLIEKQCWPGYFQDILDGRKNFDIRLANLDYKEGDVLLLREWDPNTGEYTGREIEKKIVYPIKTKDLKFWNKDDIEKYGFVVMGIE